MDVQCLGAEYQNSLIDITNKHCYCVKYMYVLSLPQ